MKVHRDARTRYRVPMAIALLFCIGCGIWQPMPQPMPVAQPIMQPISQPISQPIAQPISYPISGSNSGVFAISGSAEQQATIKAALARCDFPFDRMKPGLQRAGLQSVSISWRQIPDGTLGWASTAGEVAISNAINGLQAQRTAILEIGHVVDFFYLTPQMRKEIIKLWHPGIPDGHEWLGSTSYWDQNGEAYSVLFLWAFTDEEMWFDAGYSHKPSKELASQLRAIMLPKVAVK